MLFEQNISLEFSEILGLLCAEGSHIVSYSSYWCMDRNRLTYRKNKRSERIEFYNKDKKLLLHYQNLLLKEFNYPTKITKHGKINIGKRVVMEAIIHFTHLGHLSWRVPEVLLESSPKIKKAFVRGYFDGDGTFSGNIRFFSTNKEGLLQVSALLSSLNFKHTLQGPIIKINRKPSYILQISRKEKERFLKEVNPISKRPDCGGSGEIDFPVP